MESNPVTKQVPKWVSLVGDLRIVTDLLSSKPVVSVWGPLIFLDALCRGFAQVVFANNSLTGVLIIIALFVSEPLITAAGVFTTSVALITSVLLQQSRENICAGLTSFSAVIVGTVVMALSPSFIDKENNDLIWLFLFFGAIFSVYLTIAMSNILRSLRPALPCCTLPFNVVTFITLICFRLISSHQDENKIIESPRNMTQLNMTIEDNHVQKLFVGTLVSMSQVYAVESSLSSVIMYLGLILCSPILAVMSFIGSALGTFIGAAILGPAGYASAYSGLLGFNSLLSAAGVGGFFFVLSLHSFITAVLCAIFTIIIQLLFAASLDVASLPVCTLPFVTSTILFLATTTEHGGLNRPTMFSFPERHCYENVHVHVPPSNPNSSDEESHVEEREMQAKP